MKLRLEVCTKLSGALSHASCPLVYSRREIEAGLISDHATSYQTETCIVLSQESHLVNKATKAQHSMCSQAHCPCEQCNLSL